MRQRPSGQPTRGKTALNRLRQVDVFVALGLSGVLTGGAPLAVDVGYGAQPWTTLEMAQRWRRTNPELRVIGLEIDPERVAAALPHADPPRTTFARGGFNLAAALGSEKARVVRCYNVLRQYDESDVDDALSQMGAVLEPGGVIVEGTSNPTGGMVAFDVWRKPVTGATSHAHGLEHVALVFGTNFRAPLGPADFQTILPKRLIHRMLDEKPARFFADWRLASTAALEHRHNGRRRQWATAASALRERFGHPIDPRRRLAERGFLVLRSDLRS